MTHPFFQLMGTRSTPFFPRSFREWDQLSPNSRLARKVTITKTIRNCCLEEIEKHLAGFACELESLSITVELEFKDAEIRRFSISRNSNGEVCCPRAQVQT